VLAADAVAPSCAPIAAADHFVPGVSEFVADSQIDESLDLYAFVAQGALALKLLVIWRPDGDSDARKAMVADFITRCRARGW